MKLEELLCLGNKTLHKDQVKLLLGTLLNMNPLELNLHLDDIISEEIINKYQACLESIKNGEPLQYALKSANFYGFDFYVDKRVLIPRFETEELVDNVNRYLKKYFSQELELLDLGTGSGCIGLTLKKLNPALKVTLSDISPLALEVSKINAQKLGVDVCYQESDLFSNLKTKYDVIVSNPPYVSVTDEIDSLVKNNEPALALYSSNDGLAHYERILKDCEHYLKERYLIALEIGASQKARVLELIKKFLKDVKIITKCDVRGLDRMVFVFKNVNLDE